MRKVSDTKEETFELDPKRKNIINVTGRWRRFALLPAGEEGNFSLLTPEQLVKVIYSLI